MSYTLSNLLTDVNDRTAGETGTVTPALITRYANESLRRLRRKFDIPSAEVISQISLMTGVYFYALPYTGFKDYIALRDNYRPVDDIFMRNVSEDVFWSDFQSGNTKSESRNGTSRRLLFNFVNPGTSRMNVNALTGPTDDGTWAGTGDAGTLAKDYLFWREGSSSLSFTIIPSTGTATLTNSTMAQKNLSGIAFSGNAMFTIWVYLPSSTNVTSFSLKFGSDASNYYTISTTTQIDSSALTTGWNQLGFDWLNATTTGTPTTSAIDYVQFNMVFPTSIGTQTGVRVNNLMAVQRRLLNLHSTTDYLVIDGTTGLPKESFTNSSDTSSYLNIDRSFTDYVLYEVLEQSFTTHISDADSRAYYTGKRQELEGDLIERFPSKRQPEVQMYSADNRDLNWLRRGNGR